MCGDARDHVLDLLVGETPGIDREPRPMDVVGAHEHARALPAKARHERRGIDCRPVLVDGDDDRRDGVRLPGVREVDLEAVAPLETGGDPDGAVVPLRENGFVLFHERVERTLPGSSEETLATAQETTTEEPSDLIGTLYEQHEDDIDSVVREMKPYEYCETQHEEFLLRESFDPFSP